MINAPRTYGDPEQTAKDAAWIEGPHYLAHTIRRLEHSISKMRRKPFIIVIQHGKGAKKTRADFNDSKNYCDIFLSHATELMDKKNTRLILAHELGHIYYNFDSIKKPGFSI